MARPKPSISDLLSDGRLEQIQADPEEANDLLDHAQKHLVSANKLKSDDPAGAYQLLYDATRKALSADMLARGYRAKSDRSGAHAAVVFYAEEALAGDADAQALANLDRMRRSRNRTEYGAITLGQKQIEADLQHARAIVRAVQTRVDQALGR